MKIKLLLIFTILLLTGCMNNTNLDIDNSVQNDAERTWKLAQDNYYGNDMPINYQQALKYYEELYANEDKEASAGMLGWMYYKGLGTQPDYKKAKQYFKADLQFVNNWSSQSNLGLMYTRGQSVKQNYKKAIELFEYSSKYSEPKNNLGWMYLNGYGVTQNISKAIQLFKEAAKDNIIEAQYNLAWIYKNGIGVKKDKEVSDYWYNKVKEHTKQSIETSYELSYIYDKTHLLSPNNLYKKFTFSDKEEQNDKVIYYNNLYWENITPQKEVTTYDESKEYCSRLKIFKNERWRLPSSEELKLAQTNYSIFNKSGSYFANNDNYLYIDVNSNDSKDYVKCVSNYVKLPSKKIQKKPFQKIAKEVNNDVRKYFAYSTISPIAKPKLPSLYKIEKDVFETKAMFEKRIAKMKKIRAKQTEEILAKYRKNVENYNDKIKEQKNNLLYKKSKLSEKQREFTIQAFKKVMQAPKLSTIYINSIPKYDAENGYLYIKLGMKGAKYNKNIKVKVNAGQEAKDLFQSINNNSYSVDVDYSFATNNAIALDKVIITNNNKKYKGIVSNNKDYKMDKPTMIVLKNVNIDEKRLDKQFKLQNPNIKDVAFETYIVSEQKAFKDDIPNLLAHTAPSAIDKSKWLFIIGIENYSQTDNISFSKRSAELFKQVAKRTLGIQERNVYTLIDNRATSASIKDRMRLMLRNVKKGDKIYFYYSGHGIPVLPTREPYILPSDKIPDFVSDDKFFRVKNIYKQLSDSRASQVIVFMDSCFTGQTDGKSVFGTAKASSRLSPKSVSFNKDKMAIITAGTNNQYSNVYLKKGNRLFSYYLMKSLLKHRNNIDMLYKDVSVNVEESSRKMGDMNLQQPVFSGNKKLRL